MTVGLHWTVGFAILFLTVLGLYMTRTEAWALYELHKTAGVLAFIVAVARIAWRLKEGWPPPASPYGLAERLAAKATHWLLIVATVAMPLTGMMYSGASGHGFGLLGLTLVPENPSPLNSGLVVPYDDDVAAVSQMAHRWTAYLMLAVLVLHLAGALKHHFMDKDTTLRRMLWRVRHH